MMADEPPSPTFEPTATATVPIPSPYSSERPYTTSRPDPGDWSPADAFGISPPTRHVPAMESLAHSPPPPSSPPRYQHEFRGFANNPSPSTSPRPTYRQPARATPQDTPSIVNYLAASPRGRPVSMPQHPSPSHVVPQFVSPGPQFRDATRRTYQSRSSSRRGPAYDFRAFDTLPSPTEDSSSSGVPVLLTSSHGCLYVHEAATDSLRYLGHIDGLRGGVLSAKILPVSQRHDRLRNSRPLVAVIVHGPYLPSGETQNEVALDRSLHSDYAPSQPPTQALQGLGGRDGIDNKFQTTVEVYSLRDRQHVATLYRSPIVDVELVPGQMFVEPPPPVGSLSIGASGRFISIASAISGEVYVYEAVKSDFQSPFKCIGKVWTSIPTKKHRTWSTSASAPPAEADAQVDTAQQASGASLPTLSLSSRWLAVIPPVSSSKSTIHGTVDKQLQEKATPGLTSHAPGSHPSITCELDTPLGESLINRAARDVTQEFLKGAQWVGSQGMQAWKNYWSKPDEPGSVVEPPRSPPMNAQFPPTHASSDEVARTRHPTIVAILDLEKLSDAQESRPEVALKPAATFSLTDGCSFLSFNPNGLMLLTASKKGDVQYVWDLMRIVHPRSGTYPAAGPTNGPLVRQIARFTRMTQASILDIVWSEPAGERLAVLTERGTVHVHDLPLTAFAWPPLRIRRPSTAQKKQSDVAPPASAGGWGATLSSVTGRAQPILTAARESRIPSLSGMSIGAAGAGAGVKGGKLVATGFSKSMGAATGTVNSLYHMGENRLHIPSSSSRYIKPGIIRWIQQKEFVGLAVVGENKVQIHGVVKNSDLRSNRKRQSIIGHRLAEHDLPKKRGPDPELPCDGYVLGGFWPVTPQRPRSRATATPFSHAELETCAPFQPFHADSRVNLRVFEDDGFHADHEPTPWIFGQHIATREINTSSDDDDRQVEAAGPMDSFIGQTASGTQEPVHSIMSSRRRKGKKGKSESARDVIEGPTTGGDVFGIEEHDDTEDAEQAWLIDDS